METDFRQIYILRGIPGSGKSTYASKLVAEGFSRINKDDLRTMINNYRLDMTDENMIHEIQKSMIKMMMGFGKNIVIDNTHVKDKYVRDLLKIVGKRQAWMVNQNVKFDYQIILKSFNTPTEICVERNALRPKPVFEHVIHRMAKDYKTSKITDHSIMATDVEFEAIY